MYKNSLTFCFLLWLFAYSSLLEAQIRLKKEEGVLKVPVKINGVLNIDFILDSGASEVTIPPDIAMTLYKTGTISDKDWLPGRYYRFADGSVAKSYRFMLKSLQIGEYEFNNVSCAIASSTEAPLLLGQNVLERFGAYTIDNRQLLLSFEKKEEKMQDKMDANKAAGKDKQFNWQVGPFTGDLAFLKVTDNRNGEISFGYINRLGELVIPLMYEEATSFYNGEAMVKREGKWFYINEFNRKIRDFIQKK